MSKVTFIHAADFHLDSPFSGLKDLPASLLKEIRESPFKSFQKIVDEAINLHVDFMVISGDLFDGENRNLRTQVRFRREMERLLQNEIPAFIIHGNHDHLSGSWISVDQPENVHIFSAETEVKRYEKKDGTTVHLYGFSYPRRHVTERIIESYRKSGVADYHIGLLHGNLEGNTEHSDYAPFSLKELEAKDFDYWALGHIHKRQVVSEHPLVIYPGNIQGRNRKESGVKGCVLVEMDGEAKGHSFIETSGVIWESETIRVTEDSGFDALYQQFSEVIEQTRSNGRCSLLDIKLDVGTCLGFRHEMLEDLIRLLQEEEQEQPFVWLYKITLIPNSIRKARGKQTPFTNEISSLATDFADMEDVLAPLYKQAGARRFLEVLEQEEKEELLNEAERWLLQVFDS
ncbi:metallophosphoesterase family protein [Peribacillus sp. NPDC097675]|uniref:metallophosphoesterase family protein n=1 Tax=Peribacillus sp. NPDC097675 TaxID=3390618 RepID=UPI003CFFCC34